MSLNQKKQDSSNNPSHAKDENFAEGRAKYWSISWWRRGVPVDRGVSGVLVLVENCLGGDLRCTQSPLGHGERDWVIWVLGV